MIVETILDIAKHLHRSARDGTSWDTISSLERNKYKERARKHRLTQIRESIALAKHHAGIVRDSSAALAIHVDELKQYVSELYGEGS